MEEKDERRLPGGRNQRPAMFPPAANARHGQRGTIEETVDRLAAAAESGPLVLFAQASIAIRDLLDVEWVHILVRSGGSWHGWDRLDVADSAAPAAPALPPDAAEWTGFVATATGLFVSVRTGSVALLLPGVQREEVDLGLLRAACAALRLATGACDQVFGSPDRLEAIEAFQRVAQRILKSRDLQESLLLITHEAKMRLNADICGVLLHDEGELVMHRCVGNLSAHTGNLRMRAGQGVAGRVLQTAEPCYVEDYLQSSIISSDFYELARIERVRSALAAPLISQNAVLGVLEVWRRRASVFTPQHTAELVALASLASIAIENVRLHEARERNVEQLAAANRALQDRYELTRRTVALQDDLTRMLLEGKELAGIAEQASLHLQRPCIFLDERLHIEAAGGEPCYGPELHQQVKAAIGQHGRSDARPAVRRCGERMLVVQPIVAGHDRLGWIVLTDAESEWEGLRPLLVQVCNVAALYHVKRRAAARARADKLAGVLWDLLEAPEPVRRIAVERAQDLGMALSNDHRVMCCVVHGLEPADGDTTISAAERDSAARLAAEAVVAAAEGSRIVRLHAMRGGILAVVCAECGSDALRRYAAALLQAMVQALPARRISLGISGPASDPMLLSVAYREARIAATVAQQRASAGIVFYSDVGVTGLLMGARDEKDFRKFIADTLGPVLRESGPQGEVLIRTVRTFFKANCSRQDAAKLLRVHQKTICYRLEKFATLTGLDLARHEDRMLIDLALRMHELLV